MAPSWRWVLLGWLRSRATSQSKWLGGAGLSAPLPCPLGSWRSATGSGVAQVAGQGKAAKADRRWLDPRWPATAGAQSSPLATEPCLRALWGPRKELAAWCRAVPHLGKAPGSVAARWPEVQRAQPSGQIVGLRGPHAGFQVRPDPLQSSQPSTMPSSLPNSAFSQPGP